MAVGGVMSKRSRKIDAIRQGVRNAAGPGNKGYSYGSIPENKLNNALRSYGGSIKNDDVIGLIDTTFTGYADKGVIFTENKVFWYAGMLSNVACKRYSEMYDEGRIPLDLLRITTNSNGMKELLENLISIEGGSFGTKVSEFVDILDAVNSLFDTGNNSDSSSNDYIEHDPESMLDCDSFYCDQCGNKLREDAIFCSKCGNRVR